MSAAARDRVIPVVLGLGTLVAAVVAAELLIRAGAINRFIVPMPSQIAASFGRVIMEEDIVNRFVLVTLPATELAREHLGRPLPGAPLLGGFAASAPGAAMGSSDASTAQLVQAMAGFAGSSGAADGLNTGVVNADASQQPLLTTPQHS